MARRRRHSTRWNEYRPSRRNTEQTAPGSVRRSACSTIREPVGGVNLRRWALSSTSVWVMAGAAGGPAVILSELALMGFSLSNREPYLGPGDPGGADAQGGHACAGIVRDYEVHTVDVFEPGPADLVHDRGRLAVYRHFDG